METRHQFCTFTLNGMLFGVEVLQVQEVLLYQDLTRVPLAPPMVRGLINLRGQIVTAVDLRRRLELPAPPPDRFPMNVVVRTPDGAVSLMVDEIGDVVEVHDDAFEPAPETLTGLSRDVTRGVYKLNNRLLLILDLERVLAVQHVSANDHPAGESVRAAA